MRRKFIIAFLILILGSVSTLLLASIAPREALGQGFFLIVGLIVFFLLQFPLPQFYSWITLKFSVLIIALLFITLLIGRMSHGAQRWLPIGPFHIQVSEFGKPVLALFLAWFVTKFPLTSQRRLVIFFGSLSLFLLPVFLQPDLGSTLVYVSMLLTVVFLKVKKFRMLLPWVVFFLIFGYLVWNFALYSYQRDRLSAFLTGSGSASYNAEQAYITVGSGKLFGRGIGHGVQSQLKFLPEFHTDFFFASLVEETGALGALFILTLYIVLYWQLLSFPRRASEFSRVATVAFVAALFFQMAVHMGMNMKLFPITGIPLPLLSSGGSSFLATCIGLGLILRLSG